MVPRLRLALLLTALAAALALGGAIASESLAGLVPCALCLVERWPYRIVIGLGLLGAVLPRAIGRMLAWVAVLVLLGGVGAGVVHVGVEQGFWPSPLPECAAPDLRGLSLAQRLARMPDKPSKPCDDPTYLVPALPVSMAGMNTLYALALAGGLAIFLWRSRRSAP